jgi:hypothetical protein
MAQSRVPQVARDAIISAYYPSVVNSPLAARVRAQSAFSVAGAVAAGLVVGLVFGPAERFVPVTRILAVSAFAVWLVAVGLYMFAVGVPVAQFDKSAEMSEQFVMKVISAANDERDLIDARQRNANRVAVVAGIITLIALVCVVVLPNDRRRAATVTLTSSAAGNLPAPCSSAASLKADVVLPANGDLLDVVVRPGVCGPADVRLLLPISSVQAVTVD